MRPQFCDERTIQNLFNRIGIWERYQAGELDKEVMETGGWKRRGGQKGTRWETWRFFDHLTGATLAITKQHIKRSNGEIAGSGLPDPQRVKHDGVLYELRREPPPLPPLG